MNRVARTLILSTLVVAHGLASAGPRHHGSHHHHHHGRDGDGIGAVVLGLALAVPLIVMASQAEKEERKAEVVHVPPPPTPVVIATPVVVTARPEPVIYPRQGQSPEQMASDHHDCKRWALSLTASSDASQLQRAVEACMDGRGYTVR